MRKPPECRTVLPVCVGWFGRRRRTAVDEERVVDEQCELRRAQILEDEPAGYLYADVTRNRPEREVCGAQRAPCNRD